MTTTDGRWQPGIGDPTVMGWVTVAAYFLAASLCAAACWRQTRVPASQAGSSRVQRLFWLLMTVVLLLLGVNKQLDLQTLLTEIGRQTARTQGWYGNHRVVQQWFIAGLALTGAVGLLLAYCLAKSLGRPARVALTGCVLLAVFILVRAASFHHIDLFLGYRLWGVRMNWLFELGGIAVIALGACMALRQTPAPM